MCQQQRAYIFVLLSTVQTLALFFYLFFIFYFFIIYINDLETHVPRFKYVDDSTLFEICNTNEISEIQESIDKVADWTSMNCMKINSKKSKEMILSFTHDVNFEKSVPNITIEGIPVEVVKHAKLLGVILSDDLTLNMHIYVMRLLCSGTILLEILYLNVVKMHLPIEVRFYGMRFEMRNAKLF